MRVLWVSVLAFGAASSVAAEHNEPKEPTPSALVVVVRLEPGESKTIELDHPHGGLRAKSKAGRQFLQLRLLAKDEPKEFLDANKFDRIAGVAVVWEDKLPALTFRAAPDLKTGHDYDVEVQYTDQFIPTTDPTYRCKTRLRLRIVAK
jgi:hypothetical protein